MPSIREKNFEIDEYGCVQIDVDTTSKVFLLNAVANLIPKDWFYFSDTVSYVKGNVSASAHLTICYGVKNGDLNTKLKQTKINLQNVKESKIIKIGFWMGFQNRYILIFAVPEVSKEIFELDEWIRKNNGIAEISLKFEPHISLCYIKNISKISAIELVKKISNCLLGKTMEYEGIYFVKPISGEKVRL